MTAPIPDRLGRMPLISEPLTVEDWAEVYVLYRGFQDSMKRIARRARRRERAEVGGTGE